MHPLSNGSHNAYFVRPGGGDAARREDKVRFMGIISNGMSSVALLFLLKESKIKQEARYLASAGLNERGNAISLTGLG